MNRYELFARSVALRWGVIAILCAVLSCTWVRLAEAQSVTFGASVTNADETLSTVLTWDAPGASGCVAAGHPAWNGDKTASGTEQLPPITLSGTYQLTLTCSFPGDRNARVSWEAPTTNTDGTPLTNLAGYRIHWGESADALNQTLEVPSAVVTSYTFTDLSPGPKFFAVISYNTLGVESERSNIASKTIVAGTTKDAAVALTVNPRPSATVVEVE